jgi:hypothetical protein
VGIAAVRLPGQFQKLFSLAGSLDRFDEQLWHQRIGGAV